MWKILTCRWKLRPWMPSYELSCLPWQWLPTGCLPPPSAYLANWSSLVVCTKDELIECHCSLHGKLLSILNFEASTRYPCDSSLQIIRVAAVRWRRCFAQAVYIVMTHSNQMGAAAEQRVYKMPPPAKSAFAAARTTICYMRKTA